jgi:hypothetical protein
MGRARIEGIHTATKERHAALRRRVAIVDSWLGTSHTTLGYFGKEYSSGDMGKGYNGHSKVWIGCAFLGGRSHLQLQALKSELKLLSFCVWTVHHQRDHSVGIVRVGASDAYMRICVVRNHL